MEIAATGVVQDITPSWFRGKEPWRTTLQELLWTLTRPVVDVGDPEFAREPELGEIAFEDFSRVLRAAGGPGYTTSPKRINVLVEQNQPPLDGDPAAAAVAERALKTPAPQQPPLIVPERVEATLEFDVRQPVYLADGAIAVQSQAGFTPRTDAERRRDRLAEVRAIEIATQALEAGGWRLVRDRQDDGCGYDLLFERDGRELHAEVKGIQGAALAFNLTPKERWRAETDPNWLLIAVLSVLATPEVKAVSRSDLVSSAWISTGYRVTLPA